VRPRSGRDIEGWPDKRMGAFVRYGAHRNPPELEPASPASELEFLNEFIVFLTDRASSSSGARDPTVRQPAAPPRARNAPLALSVHAVQGVQPVPVVRAAGEAPHRPRPGLPRPPRPPRQQRLLRRLRPQRRLLLLRPPCDAPARLRPPRRLMRPRGTDDDGRPDAFVAADIDASDDGGNPPPRTRAPRPTTQSRQAAPGPGTARGKPRQRKRKHWE
jgi:hypothetical protein